MPFCPSCKYEYEPGVTRCPDCGKKLIAKLPKRETVKEKAVKLVLLRSLPSRLYAEMVKEYLEKEGIYSIIQSEDVGILGTGGYITNPIGRTSIWVPEDKVKRCNEVADQMLDHI